MENVESMGSVLNSIMAYGKGLTTSIWLPFKSDCKFIELI